MNMTQKTKEQYEENLNESFFSLHLVGNAEYENLKARMIDFCVENQIMFSMAQSVLNKVCVCFREPDFDLNESLNRITLIRNGKRLKVSYFDNSFSLS